METRRLHLFAELARCGSMRAVASPDVVLRAYAVTRRGRGGWPPVRLLLDLLRTYHGRG